MTDDTTFVNAIVAHPDDRTPRLIYADWLDERGDPRAEFVRLQVRLGEIGRPSAEYARVFDRLKELEPTVPEDWLLLMTGPVWCLAANVVGEHQSGPGGTETRRGTRLFRPNAKVYLAELWNEHSILGDATAPGTDWWRVRVVGQHRKARQWVSCIVRTSYTTQWRAELVRQPGPLRVLRRHWWPGFDLRRGDFVCPADRRSPEAVRLLLDALERGWRGRTRPDADGMA
jgi:uncharacterized protein (TIGR02996 family)